MARKRIITPERKSLSEISFLSTTLLQQRICRKHEGSARRYDTNMLEAELDEHLDMKSTNQLKKRNQITVTVHIKNIKVKCRQVEIDIRGRNAEFEPKIVPRYKRTFQKLKIK